jgi:hypothetical protein
MGQGREQARPLAPEHVALLDELRDQLLIVFLKRLGGTASFPVREVDDTGNDVMAFSVIDGVFYFTIQRKEVPHVG